MLRGQRPKSEMDGFCTTAAAAGVIVSVVDSAFDLSFSAAEAFPAARLMYHF